MSVPLPMPRPSSTAPANPSIFDQVLEFGTRALDGFWDYSTARVNAGLARLEQNTLWQLASQQQGGPATPDVQPVYASQGGDLPGWVVPVALAAGVGLIAVAVLRK